MKKYILVVGGELFNKGAQAMSFITVDYFAKKYPDCKVILFSAADTKRSEKIKNNYKFMIMPFPGYGECLSLMTGLLKKRYNNRENGKYFKQYKEIFKNAVAMIDISGYAMGSKWRNAVVKSYLRRIKLAKHFNIPVYLMPQSFGPFDYDWKMNRIIKKGLKKAEIIMARENEGKTLLEKNYKLKNVVKKYDLVLENKGIDLNNIYYAIPESEQIEIKEGSVAIIPNGKNSKFGNEDAIFDIYHEIINLLLAKNKNIYFIYHAVEDLKLCTKLKDKFFKENDAVKVIEKELSSYEFGDIVSKFDFVIASRYHSVVHSYKESVPAVVMGWAIKYKELTEVFGQERFCFDVRGLENKKAMVDAVEYMAENHSKESSVIDAKLEDIQKSCVFDCVKLK